MTNSSAFVIRSRGSLVSVLQDRLFATLLGERPATVFTTEPAAGGTVTLRDKESGKAVGVEEREYGAQLGVQGEAATWVLRRLTDGGEPVQVAGVTKTGHYTLELADVCLYAGRARFEDLSLVPKRIVLGEEEGEPIRLFFETVG